MRTPEKGTGHRYKYGRKGEKGWIQRETARTAEMVWGRRAVSSGQDTGEGSEYGQSESPLRRATEARRRRHRYTETDGTAEIMSAEGP